MERNFDEKIVSETIIYKMEEVALALMRAEEKNFCLAKVLPYNWRLISIKNENETYFYYVIVPSPAFNRFILECEYLKVVDKYPEYFSTGNDWQIIKAIKEYDKSFFVRDYSDNDFFDYIRGETMAYIFKIEEDNRVSDKILRLDLCRNIHSGNIFQGGIFHILKHFTLEGYNTLSSFGKEFSVESWREIYHIIIQNFFSNDFLLEKGNYYEAKSSLKDGHILRGIYYKNDVAQVYFLDSLRID